MTGEAEAMDQAASNAMRVAAELVSVGVLAVSQRVNARARTEEEALRRAEQQRRQVTREQSRRREQPGRPIPELPSEQQGQGSEPAQDNRGGSAAAEGDTPAAAPGIDDPELGRAPAAAGPLDSAAEEGGEATTTDKAPTADPSGNTASGAEQVGPVDGVEQSASEMAIDRGRSLVEAGTVPAGPGGLKEAGARMASQPRPSRSADLGRSPLRSPHQLSR
jgi:hypothetical protein